MPKQDELDWENTVSRNEQRENRARRSKDKEVRDRRKMLLQGASSTKQRRAIKAGVYDISTRVDDNKEGTDERIQNDGIDQISSPLNSSGGGGGGGLPDGFAEETLDIVDSNNLAAQRIFLTKDVV